VKDLQGTVLDSLLIGVSTLEDIRGVVELFLSENFHDG
jgi:hypothetical protein